MPSPHTPIAPGKGFKGKTDISDYADFLVETDWAVGKLLKALDDTGQAGNTAFNECWKYSSKPPTARPSGRAGQRF